MSAGLVAGTVVGGVLLVAAVAGMECAAERQPSAELPSSTEMPAFVSQPSETLPSLSEVDPAEGLASPAITR